MSRVSEFQACEVDEEWEPDNSESRRKGKQARVLIRIFAVIRLLITLFVTAYILEYSILQSSHFEQVSGEEMNLTEIMRIEKLVREQMQETRALSHFHRKLAENMVNIIITAFLWAGAFANNHVYLPIYVILEVAFSSFVFFSYIWELSCSQPGVAYAISVSLAFLILAYCALFVPMVIYRYCKYLETKEKEREIEDSDEDAPKFLKDLDKL